LPAVTADLSDWRVDTASPEPVVGIRVPGEVAPDAELVPGKASPVVRFEVTLAIGSHPSGTPFRESYRGPNAMLELFQRAFNVVPTGRESAIVQGLIPGPGETGAGGRGGLSGRVFVETASLELLAAPDLSPFSPSPFSRVCPSFLRASWPENEVSIVSRSGGSASM
jgi:hypothetical protein